MKASKRAALVLGVIHFSISITSFAYSSHASAGQRNPIIIIGADNNAVDNPLVQPQDPALAGGGRDQSLQFGDILDGSNRNDLIIGRLGVDILLGDDGNDVIVGGTEHFNPQNRDRAFGNRGSDVFLWAPGDGSDFFDGGKGIDAVAFGLIAEEENGDIVFRVSNDQQAGNIVIDHRTGLPVMDVTNSPGFCEIIDDSSSNEAGDQLDALGLDHLVRFSIRGVRNAFEAGEQDADNGVRVTLHLKDVEVLVCASRFGGEIEVYDLTVSPAVLIDSRDLPRKLRKLLSKIVI